MLRLPVTLALSAYALVITLVLGLTSGIIAALRQNTWVDQAAMIFAMIGISLPNFYLGLLMIIFFAGLGVSCLVIALCHNKWQIGAALTLMGAFASIYHPVGIPMIVQGAERPGFVIGVNGLVGNLGIAIGSSVSVLLATRYGWQMAYVVPAVVCLVASVAFA